MFLYWILSENRWTTPNVRRGGHYGKPHQKTFPDSHPNKKQVVHPPTPSAETRKKAFISTRGTVTTLTWTRRNNNAVNLQAALPAGQSGTCRSFATPNQILQGSLLMESRRAVASYFRVLNSRDSSRDESNSNNIGLPKLSAQSCRFVSLRTASGTSA
jgi:hypothetical protein